MSLADDLAKLNELRQAGKLSEAEFQEAATALISRELGSPEPAIKQDSAQPIADLDYENELARIDRDWQMEERRYLVRVGYGRREVPTTTMAFYLVVVGGGIGMIWIIVAIALMQSIPAAGPVAGMRSLIPLIGVVYTVVVVSAGLYCYRRAKLHQKGYRAYRARRQAVRPEQFR